MTPQTRFQALLRIRFSGAVLAAALAALLAVSPAGAAEDEATWQSLKPDMFGDRPITEDPGVIAITGPQRAEDAALVPIDVHVTLAETDPRTVKRFTVVVDENPSPLVAAFTLGPDGRRHFDLSTRVRVNAYSFVRVVAETSDGKLVMAKAFVKAAGGCSAPAVKDPVEAKAELGRMRFRVFSGTGRDEAQLQLRHPNNSGMQMNQVTRLYAPAWFIQTMSVKQGDAELFSLEGGISISEDPTFRFSYHADGKPVTVEAKDTEGNDFKETFAADGGS